jgi:lipopolysaccharide export LptBFGC system permease protein LptF
MIFRRALLQELTVNTVGVFVVLMAIISTQIIIRLLGQAASGALPADGVMGILAFTALTQLPRLLAATLFTSVLLTLSRSWRDSEMVIWMSSGQSLLSWIRPVLQFALPLALLAAVLSIGLSPWAVKNRIEYQSLLESRDELVAVAPGMFQERRKDGSIHFIESLNPISGEINRIFRHSDDKNLDDTVIAKSGFIYTDPKGEKFLILENGRRYQGTAGTLRTPSRTMRRQNHGQPREHPQHLGAFTRGHAPRRRRAFLALLLATGHADFGLRRDPTLLCQPTHGPLLQHHLGHPGVCCLFSSHQHHPSANPARPRALSARFAGLTRHRLGLGHGFILQALPRCELLARL